MTKTTKTITTKTKTSSSSSSSSCSSSSKPVLQEAKFRTLESLLPVEIWTKVLEKSDVKTVGSFAQTCHEAASLVFHNERLWRTLCRRTMGCKASRLAEGFEGGWRTHVRTMHEVRHTYKLSTVENMGGVRICGETVLHLELSAPGFHDQRLFSLMDHGIDVNAPDYVGSSPLFYAAVRTKYADVFARMLRDYHGDVNVSNVNDGTVLHQAAISGIARNVSLLLQHGASPNPIDANGDSPLHWAASRGLEDVVRMLVEAGAPVNQQNKVGESVLHCAAKSSNHKVVRYLIKKGATVNQQNSYGDTPLHQAAEFGALRTMKVLLKHQANPNLRSFWNDAPVHYASKNSVPKAIRMLHKYQADLSSRGNEGSTILHYAARHERQYKLLEWLLKRIKSTDPSSSSSSSSFSTMFFASIDERDLGGNTPLHCAALRGILGNVQLLVQYGANVHLTNNSGQDVLECARSHYNGPQIIKWLSCFPLSPSSPKSSSSSLLSLSL